MNQMKYHFVCLKNVQKKKEPDISGSFLWLVGLEPTVVSLRQFLYLVRLPISPQPQHYGIIEKYICQNKKRALRKQGS